MGMSHWRLRQLTLFSNALISLSLRSRPLNSDLPAGQDLFDVIGPLIRVGLRSGLLWVAA